MSNFRRIADFEHSRTSSASLPTKYAWACCFGQANSLIYYIRWNRSVLKLKQTTHQKGCLSHSHLVWKVKCRSTPHYCAMMESNFRKTIISNLPRKVLLDLLELRDPAFRRQKGSRPPEEPQLTFIRPTSSFNSGAFWSLTLKMIHKLR